MTITKIAPYTAIDKQIKDTYVKRFQSTTPWLNAYDPFVRAFSWASKRIGDSGIVAFVTNNSFIDAANAFDGMRKHLAAEFNAPLST